MSHHHIDIEATVEGFGCWRLTGLYGEPDRNKRRKTWDLLRNLSSDSNLSWSLIGDMNNVLSQRDKKGGEPYPNWLIECFNEVVTKLELVDMDLIGHQFTWERGRGKPEWMEVRLDSVLTNQDWLYMFPWAKLYNMEGSNSDHSLIMLIPKKGEGGRGQRKFQFENAWLLEPMCQYIVEDNWKEYEYNDIQTKLKIYFQLGKGDHGELQWQY